MALVADAARHCGLGNRRGRGIIARLAIPACRRRWLVLWRTVRERARNGKRRDPGLRPWFRRPAHDDPGLALPGPYSAPPARRPALAHRHPPRVLVRADARRLFISRLGFVP